MAGASGVSTIFLPQGMIIRIEPRLRTFPTMPDLRLSLDVNRFVHVHPDAVGPLHPEPKRVRPRKVGVVLKEDRLVVDGANHGCDDITQLEIDLCIWMISTARFGNVFMQAP